MISLPSPKGIEKNSLVDCIAKRRTVREYTDTPLSLMDLSQLLWSAQGSTSDGLKKSTPSAGELYPLHVHVLIRRVEGLESGIYEYHWENHSLLLLENTIPEQTVKEAGIGDQPWLSDSAIIMAVTASLDVATQHFSSQPPKGQRGSLYVFIESGALSQNVHLQATNLGLGLVLVAGFYDEKVSELLKLSAGIEPTMLLCIGQK